MLSVDQEFEKEQYELLLAKKDFEKLEAEKKSKKIKEELYNFFKEKYFKASIIKSLDDTTVLLPYETIKEIYQAKEEKYGLRNLIREIQVNKLTGKAGIGDTRSENLSLLSSDKIDEINVKYNQYLGKIEKTRKEIEEIERENRRRERAGEELLPVPVLEENPYEKLYGNLFSFEWKLKLYQKIFTNSRKVYENVEAFHNYFIDNMSEILVNTENNIIYEKLSTLKRKPLNLTSTMTPVEARKAFKDFFKTLNKECDKKVYISLNLYENLNFLFNGSEKQIITDDPVIKGRKLLCGVPIEVIPNKVFKALGNKELLVYGDLYNSINLIYDDSTELIKSKNTYKAFSYDMVDVRVSASYDCISAFEDIILAEIEIQEN